MKHVETSPTTILVIDDTMTNLRLLIHYLSEEGCNVIPMQNAIEALSAAQANPPALILLDIIMPTIDGYEVCARLKADERTKNIPVIFLSALESIEDKVKAFAAGGVDYITKPFQREEVLARVHTHLQLTRALRQLHEEIALRQDTQAALLEAHRLASLGTMAAGVAHELNSPLQVVTGISDDLVKSFELNLSDPQRMLQRLQKIRDSAWRCVRITEALRAYAAPTLTSRTENDLHAMVNEAIQLLQEQNNETPCNVQIHNTLTDVIPPLPCDRTQVVNALRAVLENACDALDFGGEIRVSASFDESQRKWHVHVTDNGHGMSTEIQARIFDPFFTTKPVGKGVGLGLSMVRAVLQAHNGAVQIQSAPNQGTTVTLIFSDVLATPTNTRGGAAGRYG